MGTDKIPCMLSFAVADSRILSGKPSGKFFDLYLDFFRVFR